MMMLRPVERGVKGTISLILTVIWILGITVTVSVPLKTVTVVVVLWGENNPLILLVSLSVGLRTKYFKKKNLVSLEGQKPKDRLRLVSNSKLLSPKTVPVVTSTASFPVP